MKRATGALGKKDDVWRDAVKQRDNWTCQWPTCGVYYPEGRRQGLHAHHIFRRGRMETRHVVLNGITLCFGHHMMAHAEQAEFAEMMRERLGSDQFDELQQLSRRLVKRERVT